MTRRPAPRTRFRPHWPNIAAMLGSCAAAVILTAAFLERIPA